MQRREQQRMLEKLAEIRQARARAMKRFTQAQERVAQAEARLQAARERLKAAQVQETSKEPGYPTSESGAASACADGQANDQSSEVNTEAVQDTSDTDITTKIPVIRRGRRTQEQM